MKKTDSTPFAAKSVRFNTTRTLQIAQEVDITYAPLEAANNEFLVNFFSAKDRALLGEALSRLK